MTKYQLLSVYFITLIVLHLSSFSAKAARIDNQSCGITQGEKLTSGKYGPFDYTNPIHVKDKLPRVEQFHFTRNVEFLIQGESGPISADIFYTLTKFPNHHRALYSMMKYSQQNKLNYNKMFTMECFFKRAIYFKPNDPMVYLLMGIYHHKKKEYSNAEKKYLYALKLQPKNAEINYNLGLLYFDELKLEKSKKHAILAYQNGYPLTGLKNKLSTKNILLK
ncbi:MAG: tetratricopeptide repeat protein [Colwellia sp.]|nr:tetratricopeptide repeat protein [Colwellia sp.]